ncbi:MAG: hypothetical protein HF976_04625 [ANME-2 cluster archaeon]|nr:hypothetical protein [ANME-2 cluster archaeon]MBC2706166.1 hypothetical protein [ANME-2 cluster archaeon]MBC2746997.1 hypothetical protein [ANME-2 cluster archaeon]
MNYIDQLSVEFSKGLYVNNLNNLISICEDAKHNDEYVLACHTLQCIFIGIKQSFDERAVSTDEFDFVQSKLITPILDIFEMIKTDGSEKELYRMLSNIVGIYVHLYDDYNS